MRDTLPLLFLVLLCFFANAQEKSPIEQAVELRAQHFQEAQKIALFQSHEVPTRIEESVSTEVDNARFFKVDSKLEKQILRTQPEVLTFKLPVGQEEIVTLKLYKRDLYADGTRIKVASNPDNYLEKLPPSVHYWGVVDGKESSLAAFSFSSSGVMGMFSFEEKTWDFGKLLQNDDLYVLYEMAELKKEVSFECGVSDEAFKSKSSPYETESSAYNPDNCIRVYVEVDHDIFLNKGDTAAAADYAEGAFNEVFILYANEAINATISEIFVWDVPSPYSGTGSGDYLSGFRNYNNNNGGINGDIGHLINLKNFGGVAWLNVMCGSSFNYAYSGISSSYQHVPTYSWTVLVIAHEIGHNLGSPHTHACAWYGTNSPIDCCGPEAGYGSGSCSCTMPLPSAGTVMSYCHLIGGVAIDLNEGFHPEVGSLFQNNVYNSNCLTPCPDEPLLAMFEYDTSDICTGESVAFVDSSTGAVVAWEWSFPGGTPSSSTQQNPTVFYNQSGTYDVTLIATDYKGDTSQLTVTDAVTVVDPPTAGFSFDVSGYNVQFTSESNGAEAFNWIFGDGNTSSLENPLHTYMMDATYQVTLEVTNFCGWDSHKEAVTISNPPIADLNATVTEGCAPLEVTFDANSSFNATSYYWEFPGGTPNTSDVIFEDVTYDSAGVYDVFLIASNPYFSDTLYLEDYITVNAWPEAKFTHSTNGLTVDFTNESLHADEYHYDFGDSNSSTSENPKYTYADDGTYKVTLTCTNDCGEHVYIEEVEVSSQPTAGFNSSDTMACTPSEIIFDGSFSSDNVTTYLWTFEGGTPTSSDKMIDTVLYDQPGSYDVQLIVENAAGKDTLMMEEQVVIQADPTASFMYTKEDSSFSFVSQSANYDSLLWNLGDGTWENGDSIQHTYTTEGIYEVVLLASNACATDTFSATVNAYEVPQAAFAVDGQRSGCLPFSVQFMNTSEGVVDSFQWAFESGNPATSIAENPLVTYDSAGLYAVELWVWNSAGETEIRQEAFIEVKTIPEVSFNYIEQDSLTIELEGEVIGDSTATIKWHFGDGQSLSTQENVVYTYSEPGSYEVVLIARNECGGDTSTQLIELETTTSSYQAALQGVRIYPNPADDKLVVDRLPQNSRLNIVDAFGKHIYSTVPEHSSVKLNVSSWPAGMYHMTIAVAEEMATFRVVVQE